ncbi:hypothetical protein M378DRAFT_203603 [Amanita muscaria Koide BX008]|uniref:Uncharacterized protein n=1 Tax=Amanita muscaria (strain Koide BX008) TaxID=946122 RepID=A0A0C2XNK4_AMAMK|nr:hypothetical protein M378DRAFT_203603 [Amanita muscaria Koide BX008]
MAYLPCVVCAKGCLRSAPLCKGFKHSRFACRWILAHSAIGAVARGYPTHTLQHFSRRSQSLQRLVIASVYLENSRSFRHPRASWQTSRETSDTSLTLLLVFAKTIVLGA